jgi:hypothetical protein
MAAPTIATYPLLSNVAVSGSGVVWPGGAGTFSFYAGTVGGATVSLKWSMDGGTTYQAVDRSGDTYVTFTALGSGNFELPPCFIKADVSGGSPSGLYAQAQGIRG